MDNQNVFATFLAQRDLLQLLTSEVAIRQTFEHQDHHVAIAGPRNHLMNTSLSGRREPCQDTIQLKRFSLDLGGGNSDHISTLMFDSSIRGGMDLILQQASLRSVGNSDNLCGDLRASSMNQKSLVKASAAGDGRCEEFGHSERGGAAFDAPFHKKRRLSSLGFLSPAFFDDHARGVSRRGSMVSLAMFGGGVHHRRGSMASIATFASMTSAPKPVLMNGELHTKMDIDDSDDDDHSTVISDLGHDDVDGNSRIELPMAVASVVGEYGTNRQPSSQRQHVRPKSFAQFDMKHSMEAFAEAMAKSQKSQQNIHDWDRKMGLKRSHSKTMRLSMRSRKKLKIMIRKDIGAICH
jgi:hypothetical protein